MKSMLNWTKLAGIVSSAIASIVLLDGLIRRPPPGCVDLFWFEFDVILVTVGTAVLGSGMILFHLGKKKERKEFGSVWKRPD